ncbi:MAG TPA: metallophosphoesterase, partial [Bacteroidales bacterium]|nr:metallophosphoesterase [Bacteroidales bacterium]
AIFFIVVFTVYILVNLYIFLKGYRVFSAYGNLRITYTVTFILLASTFIAGKFLERIHTSVFSDILNIAGGFWLAFMLYGFLLLFFSDIIYMVLRFSGAVTADQAFTFRKISWFTTLLVSSLVIFAGFLNALHPVVREYNINIDKKAGEIKTFRIAAVSDIHLGSIIRKRSIRILSDKLGETKPDVIFLLGDIVDGEIGPVMRGDLLKYFTCPRCRDGMYAITGNHEFIGGANITIPYIEKNGIRVLKDEVIVLDGQIQVIGRLDRDGLRFGGRSRAPLSELINKTDTSKPVIVLDHQPVSIDEAVNAGADLQLSGHTHNGQMWPLNYLTSKIYKVSYGYRKIGNTNIIVSSGFGIWGPRVRLGSRPEILVVNLNFKG